jgi:SAM-dependent methyltransferase
VTKTLIVDSSSHRTELCDLAAKYKADKGPYSVESVNMHHRKGYTAVYEMFFAPLRNKRINFLELGLQNGDSIRMFKDYFHDIEYYGIDFNKDAIKRCWDLNLSGTHYYDTDVSDSEALATALLHMDVEFDIILDDSTHIVKDQLGIIRECPKHIKSGGLLIIEDLERGWAEDIYAPVQGVIAENFVFNTFVVCEHSNRRCWDNDKIWLGVKR